MLAPQGYKVRRFRKARDICAKNFSEASQKTELFSGLSQFWGATTLWEERKYGLVT